MEQAENFDLIHNQFDFLPLTYSGLTKTPMVTTIHGFSSSKILPVYQKYNSRSHYVSISLSNRNPDLDYIANIYHGIDLKDFTFQPHPSDNYLLFLGRIHPDKGPHEAIKIAKNTGHRLILAGIIQDQAYFEKEIKPHLDNRIEFIGSVGPEIRNELMQNALAFLHPIGFAEPFGLSVIESMACGTPVIAYSKGSMPELIENGKNGFLVSDAEGAMDALKKIEQIDRNDCRQIVTEKFTQETMTRNYLNLYEKILA